jgi:uncharacterized membrane protein
MPGSAAGCLGQHLTKAISGLTLDVMTGRVVAGTSRASGCKDNRKTTSRRVSEGRMARPGEQTQLRNAGVLLGVGLGGFFDGIVLHQLLQWHHMVSNVASFSPETVPGLRINTLADGLFHAVTYVFTVLGVVLLWPALRPGERGTARQLIGLALLGWGLFNVVEGIVDHLLLGIHHVNETAPRAQWLWWDLAFLLWGAAMIAAGWWLWRESVASGGVTRLGK